MRRILIITLVLTLLLIVATTNEESVKKDANDRTLGGRDFTADSDGQLTKDDKNSRWIVNDGTDDIVLIGKRGDGTYGVDVSKDGQDVKTASIASLIFSSNNNVFKIVDTGTFSISTTVVSGSHYQGTKATSHSSGKAIPLVFASGGGVTAPLPQHIYGNWAGGTPVLVQHMYISAIVNNSFTVTVDDTLSGTTTNFEYYLLVETITL